MSTVVNPSAGNRYFTNAGAAIGSTTQPDVDAGTITAANGELNSRFSSNSLGVYPDANSRGDLKTKTVTTSEGFPIHSATLLTTALDQLVEGVGGILTFYTSEDFSAGDIVYMLGDISAYKSIINGYHYVVSTNYEDPYYSVTTSTIFTGTNDGTNTMRFYLVDSSLFNIDSNFEELSNYSFSAASGPNRDVNSRASIRTTKTATAIRAGYWDETAGEFSTAPSVSNDFSTVGADNVLTENKLAYNAGGTPVQASY